MKKICFLYRALHAFLWLLEHLLPRSVFSHFFQKYKRSLRSKALNMLKTKGLGQAIAIEQVENITFRHFLWKFFFRNKPVVFKGFAKNWECQNLSLDSLAQKYADDETVITGHGDMAAQSLIETARQVQSGQNKNARVSNLLQLDKNLRQTINFQSLKKLVPFGSFITSYQMFIGGKKNFTPLHAGLSNNFSVQLYGCKKWKILPTGLNPVISPLVDGGPLLKSELDLSQEKLIHDEAVKYLDYYEVVLQPGDVLFNPSFFWHYVEYESESITVGLRWIHFYSTFRSSLLMAFLVLTAYNPTSFKSFSKIRKGVSMPFYS